MNFWELLKALRQCWLPTAVVGIICAGLVGAGLWFLLPQPKLMARALLHVAARDPYILFPRNDGYSFEMFQRSQMALVKSRFVLNAVMKQQQPDEVAKLSLIKDQADPLQWLEKEIRVDFSISPETMRISMQGDMSQEMIVLVNAVTKTYLKEIVDEEKNKRLERLEQLKQAFARFDEKIQSKKQALQDLIKAAGTGNSQLILIKQQMALQQIGQAKNELAEIRSQMRKLHVRVAVQQPATSHEESAVIFCSSPVYPQLPLAVAGLLWSERARDGRQTSFAKERVEELIQADPEFRKLLKRETELNDLIGALRRVTAPGAPQGPLLGNEEELKSLRKKKEAKYKEIWPKYLDQIFRDTNTTSPVDKVQVEKIYLARLEQTLEKDIAQLAKEDQFLNRANLDLENLKDELGRTESYWKKVAGEIDAIEVEQKAPARIKLLEETIVVEAESKTKRLSMVVLGSFGSLMLVCFAFAWREFRTHRVLSPTHLVQTTGLQLIGSLPDYSKVARARKDSYERHDSILADSVDAVRTLLLFISKMEGIRTVLVTSAVAGEGKTFSSCHLAASLARAGRKTLIVDCDIRNPAVHKVFDVELTPGFSEVLRTECDLAAAIRVSSVDNLFLLPAGQVDLAALRMLALEKTGEIFKILKEQFDFIVLDSSPVLPVPDTLLVAQHADAAVFSILRHVSQFPKVQVAYQRLSSLGIRILGGVFNGNPDENHALYKYTVPAETT